jgi:hypothetical protein
VNDQLRALVSLRWRMVRSSRVRLGLALLAFLVPVSCVGAVFVGQSMSGRVTFNLSLLAPTALLGFACLAVLAPLAAGGGNELFPPDQLVAYPITARTTFLTSVAVAPINLAWTSQLVVLFLVTAFTVPHGWGVLAAVVTTAAYVAFVTVAGQAATWLVVGIRETRRGRMAAWAALIAVVTTAAVVVRAGLGFRVLDHSPTVRVVGAEISVAHGHFGGWSVVTAVLVMSTVVSGFLGVRACAWASRRPGDGGVTKEAASVTRRARRRSAYAELVAVDRASVWRSASLRRGALLLAVLPAVVAAGARVEWESLAILPGLVAAGAGLLFGVNMFCLDASGAVWLASLPHRPRLAAAAKLQVLVETCLLAVVASIAAGAARATSRPTAAQVVAVGASAAACVAVVVATCLSLSVRRPHRADLRGPRDTPAPPGAMAAYSVRLATLTTFIATVCAGSGSSDAWWLPLVVATPAFAWAAHSIIGSLRLWERPEVRAGVVAAVASG